MGIFTTLAWPGLHGFSFTWHTCFFFSCLHTATRIKATTTKLRNDEFDKVHYMKTVVNIHNAADALNDTWEFVQVTSFIVACIRLQSFFQVSPLPIGEQEGLRSREQEGLRSSLLASYSCSADT